MRTINIIAILCCFFSEAAVTQTLKGVQRATSANFFEYESFGNGIEYFGNTAIVGTFDIRYIGLELWVGREPIEGGRAYILERNSEGVWIEKQVLHSPDKQFADQFGELGVAISDDYAIVAASRHDRGYLGDKIIKAAGAVYIYARDQSGDWQFLQKLVASDRKENAKFGMSVSIQGDYAFVGAIGNHTDSNKKNFKKRAGAVYVFKKDKSGKWIQFQKLVATDRSAGAKFGFSMSVSYNYLCVGAYGDNALVNGSVVEKAGAAYIFKKDKNGYYNEVQKLVQDKRSALASFSGDVCLKDDQLIIGASSEHSWSEQGDSLRQTGAAYIYQMNKDGIWKLVQKLLPSNPDEYDNFGLTVAITDKRALIGTPYDAVKYENESIPNAGSAQFYEKNENGSWEKGQKLISHDPAAGHRFAHFIMLSDDFAAISEHLDGARAANTPDKNKTGTVFFFNEFPTGQSSDSITYELIDYEQPVNVDTSSISDTLPTRDTTIVVEEILADTLIETEIEEGEAPVFIVLPNPTTGRFKVKIINYESISYKIVVMNPFGVVEYQKDVSTNSIDIDLRQKSNGIYIVQVSNKYGSIKQPLIIKKAEETSTRDEKSDR